MDSLTVRGMRREGKGDTCTEGEDKDEDEDEDEEEEETPRCRWVTGSCSFLP